MSGFKRREFFRRLLGTVAGAAALALVDVDALAWAPGTKAFSLPAVVAPPRDFLAELAAFTPDVGVAQTIVHMAMANQRQQNVLASMAAEHVLLIPQSPYAEWYDQVSRNKAIQAAQNRDEVT